VDNIILWDGYNLLSNNGMDSFRSLLQEVLSSQRLRATPGRGLNWLERVGPPIRLTAAELLMKGGRQEQFR
jgi:hypothetical protein